MSRVIRIVPEILSNLSLKFRFPRITVATLSVKNTTNKSQGIADNVTIKPSNRNSGAAGPASAIINCGNNARKKVQFSDCLLR